jgi:hypothetical protein
MDKTTAFSVIHNYKVEKLDFEKANYPYPYDKKDGEAYFLIDIEHLNNGERQAILDEKNQELSKIFALKLNLSRTKGSNSGLYIPTIKWLEDPKEYETWLSEKHPKLTKLEHAIYLIDSCPEGEECGHCGSYFIYRKSEMCTFRALSQVGIVINLLSHFKEINEEEKRKIESAWQIKRSYEFGRMVDEKTKINHLEDIPELGIKPGEEKWMVCKNIDEELRKFSDPEEVERLANQIYDFIHA